MQVITHARAVISETEQFGRSNVWSFCKMEQTAAHYTACVCVCVWLYTPNCGVWGKASALRRNCSRPVPTVQLLCVSLKFLSRACAERAGSSGLTLGRMRDTGNFVHRARRAPLWTRTGSRTDCVIDFKQLELLLHKSNGSEKVVSCYFLATPIKKRLLPFGVDR